MTIVALFVLVMFWLVFGPLVAILAKFLFLGALVFLVINAVYKEVFYRKGGKGK